MVLTSVQLTEADHKFVTDNGLKFSELMREAIFRHREVVEGNVIDNVNEARRKNQRLAEHIQNAMNFIEAKGLTEDFLNEERNNTESS